MQNIFPTAPSTQEVEIINHFADLNHFLLDCVTPSYFPYKQIHQCSSDLAVSTDSD